MVCYMPLILLNLLLNSNQNSFFYMKLHLLVKHLKKLDAIDRISLYPMLFINCWTLASSLFLIGKHMVANTLLTFIYFIVYCFCLSQITDIQPNGP